MGYTNMARPKGNRKQTRGSFFAIALALLMLVFSVSGWAQSTVGTGSITGMVTDPTGAVVSGAKVIITNIGTGQVSQPDRKRCRLRTRPALSILAITKCKFRPRASAA